jgi:hypothetical protein
LYSALIMRKGRVNILDHMNQIVAARMSYVDKHIQLFQLKEECRKHIFPVYAPNPKYESLKLVNVTGAMAFLFVFLSVSVFVLFVEIILVKLKGATMRNEIELQTFDILMHLRVDNTFSREKRQRILAKYVKLLTLLDE